jgi:hypothetical protein
MDLINLIECDLRKLAVNSNNYRWNKNLSDHLA